MRIENKGTKTVLAISDLHAPFQHPDHIEFLSWLNNKFKPEEIVNVGDEIDAHALSDYTHDPDGMSAGDELSKAIESLQPLYKMFPKMKVCTSNHTSRPYRRAQQFGIPRAFLKEYKEFLASPPGWEWADSWEVDGVIYEHGEGFSGQVGAINAAKSNMNSTVIGHIHSFAGIQYSANQKHLIFGMNVGCLIDTKKYAFAYGRVIKTKPIIGCGLVVKGIPIFVPMILDRYDRWIGK